MNLSSETSFFMHDTQSYLSINFSLTEILFNALNQDIAKLLDYVMHHLGMRFGSEIRTHLTQLVTIGYHLQMYAQCRQTSFLCYVMASSNVTGTLSNLDNNYGLYFDA
jgi:hypothetical protein